MAQEHVAAGDRAFVDEDFEAAVKHYTKALELGPSAAVYEARANANIELERFMEAVQDASKAVELDSSNAKAYLRKGTACFHLEEYETALQCFEQGQQLAPDMPKFRNWIRKCKAELDDEMQDVIAPAAPASKPPAAAAPAASAPAAPAPAASTPAAAAPIPAASAPAAAAAAAPAPAATAAASAAAAASSSAKALAPAAVETFTGRYRHQWYQIGSKVVIDVYAKNLPKDAVTVQLTGEDDKLRITIAAQPAAAGASSSSQTEQQQQQEGDDEDFVLEFDLFSKVVPDKVKAEVLKTKVEVSLLKAQPALSWRSLEKGAAGPAAAGVAAAAVAPEQGPPRAYPSSKPTRDWGKVEAEVKELEEKGELDDADPLGAFFKKIFSQGDEDTRRAMMKSFVESNGTVLSTNWKDVGAKKIECTPPEGMELHKWQE